jgi:hypothetical protein
MKTRALLTLLTVLVAPALFAAPADGLLFYLSADHGTTADVAAPGTATPTFDSEVTAIPDGARGAALRCGDLQRLAWRAPGNIYAERGTLSFFWRARDPVGPTEFPVFRVAYADHSSWDMVWLRIDYNGHGFDAFVTDASLARTRVSVTLDPFPAPSAWTHLAVSWDETRGLRFYVNGRLAAQKETTAVYAAALDQFGPHSRIISPYQVQSDYNFTRGGDIDEVRIYDRMLDDASVATLATGAAAPPALASASDAPARFRAFQHRYGFDRPDMLPPYYSGPALAIRKVEIHDAYDQKRWWWKANDGIRETTWPGVYNRSRLPGRNDYFQLPDWDCYSTSGHAITFALPEEPWNHLEIAGAAFGKMELLPPATVLETAYDARAESTMFSRRAGQEKSFHTLEKPLTGRQIRFTNVEQETPIGELVAYHVTTGTAPTGRTELAYRLAAAPASAPSLAPLTAFIASRFAPAERSTLVAIPASTKVPAASSAVAAPALPLVHILIPNTWDQLTEGLDGIALDLPKIPAERTALVPLNLQVHDPLWPLRLAFDFTFSVKPNEPKTLWLDLRDRLLPSGKALWLSLASASPQFNAALLAGAKLRLVFKPRAAALAEHELDRFTQARDSYAMLVEEHPNSPKFDLWVRFETDLNDLLRANPDHVLGRHYRAVAFPSSPRPAFTPPTPPPGVPLWAFRQVTQLGLVDQFVNWYIDHRQIANGEFGGGISDDTDLLNVWPGVAFMGCSPEKIAVSNARLLDAAYANGMFTRGIATIQTDELHSYEEGINTLGQNLILNYGSPRQLERAMENARGFASITGVNAAGHRHIRSSYYSGTKLAEEGPWGWAKSYSYLVAQPSLLLVDYNGNPTVKKTLVELADGLLAHRKADEFGAAAIPTSIHFSDDAEGTAIRGNLPWPIFWGAYTFTGNRDYLAPILGGGPAGLMTVNANALDALGLRTEWRDRFLSGERSRPTETRRADGRTRTRESTYRGSGAAHVAWQLTGDKKILEKLYGDQIEETVLLDYINTVGSLWIDRVGVPYAELQRARLGGIALVRGATFPGHTVSWKFQKPATAQSIALLIPDATPTSFKVIAYNLETAPVHATMTGWHLDPGLWEMTQGLDTNDDDVADAPVTTSIVPLARSRSVELTLAPRAATVLTFKLKTPGTPYWSRPDLGLDRQDVVITGREISVTVHSLGAVEAPAARVLLRSRTGDLLATATTPALAAPLDLTPKTATVTLTVPAGADLAGATVTIEPSLEIEELTALNNTVAL